MAKPEWNDANYLTAFDAGNRRGANSVYLRNPIPRNIQKNESAGNGNFQLSVPVIRLAGRGLDLSLDLTYNSLIWHKNGNTLSFNIDDDWPAPGWSLGFGKLVRTGWGPRAILFGANGTRHPFQFQSAAQTSPAWQAYDGRSNDGTFIDCRFYTPSQRRGIDSAFVKHPDGTVVEFNTPGDDSGWGEIHPKSIFDRHGNYLSISYRNNTGPEIDTITDTLGRIFNFHYDSNSLLTAITGPGLDGAMRTFIRLHYKQFEQSYGFHESIEVDYQDTAAMWMIDAIYFPATATGYWFGDPDSFSSYAMMAKVIEQRSMGFTASSLTEQGTVTPGTMTRQQVYNYPLVNNFTLKEAPKYSKMTEIWAGMDTPPAVTNYVVKQDKTRRRIEVTSPDGTRLVQLSYNTPGQFTDGLVYLTETYDAGNRMLQQTTMQWEQGDYDSPRVLRTQIWDELNQMTATGYIYGPAYNQVKEVDEYDYGGATLLRKTRTDYETAIEYVQRHIFNLPKTVRIFKDYDQVPTSRIEFSYDGQPLTDTPDVVQYRNDHNPYASSGYVQLTGYRGNITRINKYADAANVADPISETRRYDITGNLIAVSDPSCCELRSTTYNSAMNYAYPVKQTRGAADPASPARLTTNANYDYNTGKLLTSTDANGRKTQIIYSSTTLKREKVIWPTLASISYEYDDAQLTATETMKDNNNMMVIGKRVKKFNGLGLIRREETLAEGSQWDIIETQYDALGRPWKQTRPFRSGEVPKWNQIFYDVLGRTTKVHTADGSEVNNYYNEANRPGPARARTVRTVDTWGRERLYASNALGHLQEVVEPNPKGNGSVFGAGVTSTYYRYNALDQLVQVVQGPQSQTRDFRYNSLGQLTHQSLPEKNATLNDAGEYGRPGARWTDVFIYNDHSNLESHIDARGVNTIYDYANDPLNRLQGVRYDDVTGFGDTENPVLQAASVSYAYMTTGDVTRLQNVMTQGVNAVEYGYDLEGRLSSKGVTMTGQPGTSVTNYSYDVLNRLTDVSYPIIQWDVLEGAEGLSSTRNPRRVVHYEYDMTSRIKKLQMSGAEYASKIIYNAAGQLTSLKVGETGPLQLAEEYAYDSASGLLTRQEVHRAGMSLLDLSYGYLRAGTTSGISGQLTEVVNSLDERKNRNYGYDALGRLRFATGGIRPLSTISSIDGLSAAEGVERAELVNPYAIYWEQIYDYDLYGNRTSVTSSGRAANGAPVPKDGLAPLNYYTNKNQITEIGFPFPSFSYDKAGNLTRGLCADGAWRRYQYDAAGRLRVVANDAGETVESFVYGSDRHRIIKETGHLQTLLGEGRTVVAAPAGIPTTGETGPLQTSHEVTYYSWSGDQVLEESTTKTDVGVNNQRKSTKSCVYMGGRLLATVSQDGSGEAVRYHHPDRLGTRLVTNAANASMIEQVTTPYGVPFDAESTGATNQRFTSYDRSGQTGLDYAINREYDSQQGRFTQVDPFGMRAANLTNPQSLNLYAYVGNDPINNIDPTGLVEEGPKCVNGKIIIDGKEFKCEETELIGDEIVVRGPPPDEPSEPSFGSGFSFRVTGGERRNVEGRDFEGTGKVREQTIQPELLVCQGSLGYEQAALGQLRLPPIGWLPPLEEGQSILSTTPREMEAGRRRAEEVLELQRNYPGVPEEWARFERRGAQVNPGWKWLNGTFGAWANMQSNNATITNNANSNAVYSKSSAEVAPISGGSPPASGCSRK